ncbi:MULTISPECIES: hypothetical protein [Burkholderiaceae]|uniref:hypothetical protein n=1 Tax=Burkholderiaceae TaxID=119060 RepID=UPI00095B5B6F|nr:MULTISPECIES: hypothetical protein [Burkholderiaceae]MCG1039841.1 hypothetical protein [Mycetohabitans sp. B7]SIT71217.1 hypothetical protein SAMN04487769_1821 [Burkholderia sp. b14]
MKTLAIATAIGVLCATLFVTADACAATAAVTGASSASVKSGTKKPEPSHRLFKKRVAKKAAAKTIADPVPEGATKWGCAENSEFFVSGDMKRDQIVTVHWAGKNYKLPREQTTTGADRFHDAATGLDLIVIPTKAMLFSDKNSSRLADECKTPAMVAGAPAPIQTEALKQRPGLLQSN